MISATRAGSLTLRGLSKEEQAALARRLVVVERRKAKRFGVLVDVARPIALVRRAGRDAVTIPRALEAEALTALGLPGLPVEDATTAPVATFTLGVALRSYQSQLGEALAGQVSILATAATGSGKTIAALGAIARLGLRALVLVPTIDLARQWAREAARVLGVEAALCVGGAWSDAAAGLTIATPETALRHTKRLGAFGVLVVDECHGFATRRRIFSLIGKIPARYRLGLTATLPSDHRGGLLLTTFGPVGFRFGVDAAIEAGTVLAPERVAVPSSFSFPYTGPESWAPMLDALAADEERIALVSSVVAERCAGRLALVLSARLAHLEGIRGALEARGVRVAVVAGNVPSAQRRAALEAARAGQLDALLGSTVADEGLDLPELGAVVLTFPSRSESRLLQRIGRCLRPSPGKPTPIVFDVEDHGVGPLRSQARQRAAIFARVFAGTRTRTRKTAA